MKSIDFLYISDIICTFPDRESPRKRFYQGVSTLRKQREIRVCLDGKKIDQIKIDREKLKRGNAFTYTLHGIAFKVWLSEHMCRIDFKTVKVYLDGKECDTCLALATGEPDFVYKIDGISYNFGTYALSGRVDFKTIEVYFDGKLYETRRTSTRLHEVLGLVGKYLQNLLQHTLIKNSISHDIFQSVTIALSMAKLTREDILKLARLARLRLTEAEADKFQDEISNILGYVEQLESVSTDNLKPTYQVTGLTNVSRPDEVRDYGVTPDELLANAPAKEGRYFKVKRMIG